MIRRLRQPTHPCGARSLTLLSKTLTSLHRFCAYATQKQALNALAFFFKQVCGVEDPVFGVKLRKTGTRIPVVLSKEEARGLFAKLEQATEATEATEVPRKSEGRYGLPARLQYGAGLRRSELVRLRIKDVDLSRSTLTVRQGKGDKDCLCLRQGPAHGMAAPPQPWVL